MRSRFSRSAGYAEGVRDTGETVLFLADTSCQWDFRESATCRGKGIRDAVVASVATSVHQSVGKGFRALGWDTVRSAPCTSVVRTTGRRRRIIHSACQQFPRGRSGERSLDPHGAGPGEQGSRPQVSRQWKHWKSQTTRSVSGPRETPGKGFGDDPPTLIANGPQETGRYPAGIQQPTGTARRRRRQPTASTAAGPAAAGPKSPYATRPGSTPSPTSPATPTWPAAF